MKAKWLFLDNHIPDVHIALGNLFLNCSYGTLYGLNRKKWFRRRKCNHASIYRYKLNLQCFQDRMKMQRTQMVACTKYLLWARYYLHKPHNTRISCTNHTFQLHFLLCKDITGLSPLHQTSSLESFHSVIIHFGLKSVALFYLEMKCRYTTCMHSESVLTVFVTIQNSTSCTILQRKF